VYAELLPDDKVKVIQHLQQQYKTVAMVDGINDAPVLAQASVELRSCWQRRGTGNGRCSFDGRPPGKLVGAIRLGRSQVIVKQNIAFALSTLFCY